MLFVCVCVCIALEDGHFFFVFPEPDTKSVKSNSVFIRPISWLLVFIFFLLFFS